jgi:hypothetical protein
VNELKPPGTVIVHSAAGAATKGIQPQRTQRTQRWKAFSSAENAQDLATTVNQPTVAKRNRQLLAFYRAGKPYHEPEVVWPWDGFQKMIPSQASSTTTARPASLSPQAKLAGA